MSDPDVLTHLGDTWTRHRPDREQTAFGSMLDVAVHESGCELWCSDTSATDRIDDEYYVAVRQPVSSNGWQAYPTTGDGVFETVADVEQFIRMRGDGIDRGVEVHSAVAIVPHDSSQPFVDDDGVPMLSPSAVPTDDVLADVWTITPATSSVPADAFADARVALVSYLYPSVSGSSDALDTVSNPDMAYDDVQLDLFTVAPPEDLAAQ